MYCLVVYPSCWSVCLSVCVCSVLCQNGWLDLDAVWDGEWGRSTYACGLLDRGVGRKGMGSFGSIRGVPLQLMLTLWSASSQSTLCSTWAVHTTHTPMHRDHAARRRRSAIQCMWRSAWYASTAVKAATVDAIDSAVLARRPIDTAVSRYSLYVRCGASIGVAGHGTAPPLPLSHWNLHMQCIALRCVDGRCASTYWALRCYACQLCVTEHSLCRRKCVTC